MTWKEYLGIIDSDLYRWGGRTSFSRKLRFLLFNASFKLTFWFRTCTYLRTKKNIISKCMFIISYAIYKHVQYKTGIQIPVGTNIGKGLLFPHFSAIVINSRTVIGDNCTIMQQVTIGSDGKPHQKGARITPIIGNNVVISCGAKVLGGISIGDNVVVGAGALVVKDVPDFSVVAGVPSKVISNKGKELSEHIINQYFDNNEV